MSIFLLPWIAQGDKTSSARVGPKSARRLNSGRLLCMAGHACGRQAFRRDVGPSLADRPLSAKAWPTGQLIQQFFAPALPGDARSRLIFPPYFSRPNSPAIVLAPFFSRHLPPAFFLPLFFSWVSLYIYPNRFGDGGGVWCVVISSVG